MSRHDNTLDHKAGLASLQALILGLEAGAEQGLSALPSSDDPEAVSARLALLINAKRFEEAALTLKDLELHPRWADKAVIVHTRLGADDHVARVISWAAAKGDVPLRNLCLLRQAHETLNSFFDYVKSLPADPVPSVRAAEAAASTRVLAIIAPVVDAVRANGVVQTALEEQALLISLEAASRLHNHSLCEELGRLLLPRTPLPLGIARLALESRLPPPSDVPDRLRSEYAGHPDFFEAHMLAAEVEAVILKRPAEAYRSLRTIERAEWTAEEREEYCRHLASIAGLAGEAEVEDSKQVIARLLAPSHSLAIKYSIEDHLTHNRLDKAASLLDSLSESDDPEKLQLWAALHVQKGDKQAALSTLLPLMRQFPHRNILHKIAGLAIDLGNYAVADQALGAILDSLPNDKRALYNSAIVKNQLGQYAAATVHLRALAAIDPSNANVVRSLARTAAFAGDDLEAEAAFGRLCQLSPQIEDRLSYASFLRSVGKPQLAFDILWPLRDELSANAQHLLFLAELGYATGKDDKAGAFFAKAVELQRSGSAPGGLITEFSLEQVLDMAQAAKSRDDSLHQDLTSGRLGWVGVELLRRNSIAWGWTLRTQPLDWLHDNPVVRASHTIYSTNHVRLHKSERSAKLVTIACSRPSGPVVADISALITLFRLGIFDAAIKWLGRVHIPSEYSFLFLSERAGLLPHQQSSVTAVRAIASALSSKSIAVAGVDDLLPVIDEYVPEEERGGVYGLSELFRLLQENGLIPDSARAQLAEHHVRPAAPELSPLRIGQVVVVGYMTLRTLANLGWLDSAAKALTIHISRDDQHVLEQEIRSTHSRDLTHDWLKELRAKLSSHSSIVVGTSTIKANNDADGVAAVAMASIELAKALDVPLLADDRFAQTAILNQESRSERSAFGCDSLIEAMWKDGSLEGQAAADALLTLIRWRYRFIVVPPGLLKAISDRHREHPPGLPLRQIAAYVHDCMRDPGLHAGFEPTHPPISCAWRLAQEWINHLAAFVVDVWRDDAYSDQSADALTNWVLTEAVPSTSRQFGPMDSLVAEHIDSYMVGMLGVHSPRIGKRQRAAAMFQAVRSALSMEPAAYLKVVRGVLDGAK